jgi:hypothetical protein
MPEPNWPNPINWFDFQAAINDKKFAVGDSKVFVSDGREYRILQRKRDHYWITANKGLVPCGEFTRKQINDSMLV